jgi:hypothetical protein
MIPVSPVVFDSVHKLEGVAWDLRRDMLHPACDWAISHNIKAAIKQFGDERATFITDSAALDRSQRALTEASNLVSVTLRRYHFMEKVIEKSRDSPEVGRPVEGTDANQKWVWGVVPLSAQPSATPRRLALAEWEDGITGFEVMLEVRTGRTRPSQTLRFEGRIEVPSVPHKGNPTEYTVNGMSVRIVGWSLSCRTAHPLRKSFTVTTGGIMTNTLRIQLGLGRVSALFTEELLWRFRIFFVNRCLYDFPTLRK